MYIEAARNFNSMKYIRCGAARRGEARDACSTRKINVEKYAKRTQSHIAYIIFLIYFFRKAVYLSPAGTPCSSCDTTQLLFQYIFNFIIHLFSFSVQFLFVFQTTGPLLLVSVEWNHSVIYWMLFHANFLTITPNPTACFEWM